MLASSVTEQFLAGMLASLTLSSNQSSLDFSFVFGKADSDVSFHCAGAFIALIELNGTHFVPLRANCTLASRDTLLQLFSLPEQDKLTLRAFPLSNRSLLSPSLATFSTHRASAAS